MTTTTHPSRSGRIQITKTFYKVNGMWCVFATETSGRNFASKFFLTEDEAKSYANHLWATDGNETPVLPDEAVGYVQTEDGQTTFYNDEGHEVSSSTYSPTPWVARWQNEPASPKALSYLHDLAVEHQVPADRADRLAAILAAPTPNAGDVSLWIDELKAAPAVQVAHTRNTLPPMPEVPAGHYATPSRTGNNDLDFWTVDRPTEGRWAGYTFVKRVIGGHEDQSVRGSEARQALEAIVAEGLEQVARRYGQEIGRCGRCNRSLTDETSRAYGIGPDCRSKEW